VVRVHLTVLKREAGGEGRERSNGKKTGELRRKRCLTGDRSRIVHGMHEGGGSTWEKSTEIWGALEKGNSRRGLKWERSEILPGWCVTSDGERKKKVKVKPAEVSST